MHFIRKYYNSDCMKSIIRHLPNNKLSLLLFFLLNSFFLFAQEEGKSLFKQNCAACHTVTDKRTVGPGLAGINEKRNEEWLIKWIKDSQVLVKGGDADAVKVFEEFGKMPMPSFAALTDAQIKSILAYVKESAAGDAAPAATASSDAVAPVVVKAPLSTGFKLFAAVALLGIIGMLIAIVNIKKRLSALGYNSDSMPLGDRISNFVKQNGTLVIVSVVVIILCAIISLAKEWM